jgi:hypothetical protein
MIDVLLFQGSRPIAQFVPAVGRAIAEAGLTIEGDLQLREVHDPKFGDGVFQSFFVTNGWLTDNNAEAYDLFLEIEGIPDGDFPEMETYNSTVLEDSDIVENPLCFKIGIEDLSQNWAENDTAHIVQPKPEPEAMSGNGRGRVKNPDTDMRLKENQNRPEQLVTPRRTQDDNDTGGTERIAGRPGRVRFQSLDGRLKKNRRLEEAGGR